jgi:hypothetical protein
MRRTVFAIPPLAAALALAIPPPFAVAAETGGAGESPSAPVRTLEDVTIEGEVRLPQVLFISSRDAERPLEALAFFGPADPREVALATPIPDEILAPGPDPVSAPPSPVPPDDSPPAPSQEVSR